MPLSHGTTYYIYTYMYASPLINERGRVQIPKHMHGPYGFEYTKIYLIEITLIKNISFNVSVE